MKPIRVKITTCIPSPYQVELFDSLAARDDIRIKVLYWRATTKHFFTLASSTQHPSCVLKGFRVPLPFVGADKLCPRIIGEIWRRDYDVFVVSGLRPTALLGMFLLALLGRTWVFWGERPYPVAPGTLKAALKRLFYGLIGRFSRGVIGMGKLALQEYRRLGVPADRLVNVPYSPDVSTLLEPQEEHLEKAAKIRQSLAAGDDTVFLFCGQLVERKAVDVLLKAFAKCYRQRQDCLLLVVGDGPQRETLEAMVPDDVKSRVVFAGVLQRPELLHYFLAADVFVLPSRYDGWGVVVTEAMAAGLPVVTTDNVGAAADMVVEGENGCIVPADSVADLAQRMREMAQSAETQQRMGRAARQTAAEYTATAGAEKMVRALRTLVRSSDC